MTSSAPTPLQVVVEGLTDQYIVRRILSHLNMEGHFRVAGGKQPLLNNLGKYHQAAAYSHRPYLVILDLDAATDCPGDYVRQLISQTTDSFLLRLAVQAVEAWLLADRQVCAQYLQISEARIPLRPDQEADPKQTLLNLVRHSPKQSLKQDMLPVQGSRARVGPGYVNCIAELARMWRPNVAEQHSESLRRCLRALSAL